MCARPVVAVGTAFAFEGSARPEGAGNPGSAVLTPDADGEETFDFGIGDEAFKYRFATQVPRVRTWWLGPQSRS